MPSQFQEDLWIEENVDLPAEGFYLDVGCAFPDACSNTQFLRSKGWQGLAIDANPGYAKYWPAHFMVGIVSTQPVVLMDFRETCTHSRIGNKGVHHAARPPLLGSRDREDRPDLARCGGGRVRCAALPRPCQVHAPGGRLRVRHRRDRQGLAGSGLPPRQWLRARAPDGIKRHHASQMSLGMNKKKNPMWDDKRGCLKPMVITIDSRKQWPPRIKFVPAQKPKK